ncbi:hypothetical protein D9M72_472450 [compost metagenome]
MEGVLRRHRCEVALRHTVFGHEVARHAGVEVHEQRARAAGFGEISLGPIACEVGLEHGQHVVDGLQVHRAMEHGEGARLVSAMELFVTGDENDVVCTQGDHLHRLLEGRGRGGTCVLDVYNGDAPDAHTSKRHLPGDQYLPGHHSGGGVAHVGSL